MIDPLEPFHLDPFGTGCLVCFNIRRKNIVQDLTSQHVAQTSSLQPQASWKHALQGFGGCVVFSLSNTIGLEASVLTEMTNIAAECLKTPSRTSIWSPRLGKYVCRDTPEGQKAVADFAVREAAAHPPINPQFKLVFLTSVIGTLAFIALCVVCSLIAGKEPPPLFERVIMGFFDLAKIGLGTAIGLLGGRRLQGGYE